MANHMDVDALVASDLSPAQQAAVHAGSAVNLKRPVFHEADLSRERSPYPILATQEIKTTWHPIETPIGGGGGY